MFFVLVDARSRGLGRKKLDLFGPYSTWDKAERISDGVGGI